MTGDIRTYARLGYVHHMLYPDSIEDPGYHEESLLRLIERKDMETFDCCLPFEAERRQRLVPAIQQCGKEVVACAHLSFMQKISPSSTVPSDRAITRILYADQIDVAGAMGATGFVFVSGRVFPEGRVNEARAVFADFCRWFCTRLKFHGITALLEPFDTTIDKKFLYGSTEDCIDLIRSLEPDIDNLGINLDFAHIPLMFENAAHAVSVTAPYIRRVHLGNCVLQDRDHPWYGDKHPPIGFPGGETDVPELAEHLRLLLEYGYLDREKRGALIIEMRPFPNMTVDETIEDALERLEKAWNSV